MKNLFKSRLNRRNYLIGYVIFYTVNIMVLYSVKPIIELLAKTSEDPAVYAFPIFFFELWLILFTFVSIIFSISLVVRRLHDFGKSGWYGLILLIPFINILFLIIMLFIDGNHAENKYGKKTQAKFDVKAVFGLAKSR